MRINISITDKMNEEIQKQKEFNVSKVCREALETALKIRTSIFQATGHKERLQELAKQKGERMFETFEIGSKYGRNLVLNKDFSYGDLAVICLDGCIPKEHAEITKEIQTIAKKNNFKYDWFHKAVIIGIKQVLEEVNVMFEETPKQTNKKLENKKED